jgi:AAHS family 4-hydroxybenzoate transporter-like MFS transporter
MPQTVDVTELVGKAPFGRFQFGITALCALVAVLDGFDTQAIAYVAPVIAEQWHIDPSGFGPIFGAGLAGLMVGAFILSPAADRFGRKSIIMLSLGIFGLLALGTAWATSTTELLVLRFLTGLGLGGAMPNIIALTSEYAPARLRAMLISIMFCGFPLGSTLGGLISTQLIAASGWPSVFVVGGLLPLFLLAVLWVVLPESVRFLVLQGAPPERIRKILSQLDPSNTPAPGSSYGLHEIQPRGFPAIKLFQDGRAQTTLLLWIAFFMNLLVMYFLVNWLPSLLRASGLSLQVAIMSTAVLNLGGVVGALVLGRMIDRMTPPVVLGSAYLASAVFIGLVALHSDNMWVLMPATFMTGFGVVGAQIGMNALAAGTYPTAIRATGVGWALGVGRIGSIIGPVLGGVLLGMGWSASSLVLTAALPIVLASLAVFALRWYGHRAPTLAEAGLVH